MFFYRPTAAQAWDDIYTLQTSVTFGLLVRNMHRWAAHLMVLSVFLHMARVFYHGAYKAPREFNWVIGVILLTPTLLLSIHRLPTTLGSVSTLGSHSRNKYDGVYPCFRRSSQVRAPWGCRDRHRHTPSMVCASCSHASLCCSYLYGNSLLASKERWRYLRSVIDQDRNYYG